MTGNIGANFVCNQLIRVIKESNLNYLVNETPYSAFITIRKKFVKNRDGQEAFEVDSTVNDLALGDVVLRQENLAIRQKLKDLETVRSQLSVTNEELDLKNEALENDTKKLESEKSSLFIRLEVAQGQISNLSDRLNKQVEDTKEIKVEKDNLGVKLKDTATKIVKLESELKEKDDNLVLSEFSLKNKDAEIERLENLLEKLKTKKYHFCDECSFSSESDEDLKVHIRKEHEHKCPHCNTDFVGKRKLRSHMCRIRVNNPLSEQFGFYTKDWFEREKCIRIFDNVTKDEVILLHSEHCINNKVCSDLPKSLSVEKFFKDTHGLIHLIASNFMNGTNMKWMEMLGFRIIVNARK